MLELLDLHEVRKFIRRDTRRRCAGYEKAQELRIQHAHVCFAVGVFHVAGQDACYVLVQIKRHGVRDGLLQLVCGPAGAVAVRGRDAVAHALTEVCDGVSDHHFQIIPAANIEPLAQLLAA